jgi:hypothetical protein
VSGSLKPKEILVRPRSDYGQAYPQNPKVGQTYILRLTPLEGVCI